MVADNPYRNTEFLILEFNPGPATAKVWSPAFGYSASSREEAINSARTLGVIARDRGLSLKYVVVRIATEAVFPA